MVTLKQAIDTAARLSVEFASLDHELRFMVPYLLNEIRKGNIKRGKGQPILILPGFMATDGSIKPLMYALRLLGYNAYTWEQGQNHGNFDELEPGILKRFDEIYEKHGRVPVYLIGWSKGGRMALKLAEIRGSECVAGILTIGSPIWPLSGRSPEDVPQIPFVPVYWLKRFEDIIVELNGPAPMVPLGIPVTSIILGFDMIVSDKEARLPDWMVIEGGIIRNNYVGWCGHLAGGFSVRTLGVIVRHIHKDYERWNESHLAQAA